MGRVAWPCGVEWNVQRLGGRLVTRSAPGRATRRSRTIPVVASLTSVRADFAPRGPRGAVALALLLAACGLVPSPSAGPSGTLSPASSATAGVGSPSPTVATPTPEPTLSLDPPADNDPRQVAVSVVPALTADGGRVTVTIVNQSDSRIAEIVLRWPTALADTIFLAPFEPSQDRIREGGDPLTVSTHWTKWVEGPGENGEPAGTTSLGYGPMDAGMTLEIPLWVTRRAPGPVAFDLQVLAGESILTTADGLPAEVRVSAP